MIKKWFTLIEMLIVIVIIGILMAALLPKLSSAQYKAKDKKTAMAVRDYLVAQKAGDHSYPIHASDFSKKAYLIDQWRDWTDISSLVTKDFKKDPSGWGKWSWIYIYRPSEAKQNGTEANKFLKQILSKLSSKDMAQLTWNDNSVVVLWFFWNLWKILAKYKTDTGVPNLIKTLKEQGFTYIDKVNTTNPAKAVWGWFVLRLDKTPGNGWVKISDSTLISDNEELKSDYVNFAWVADSLNFMPDLVEGEEAKKAFVTSMLKAIKAEGISIADLSAGN